MKRTRFYPRGGPFRLALATLVGGTFALTGPAALAWERPAGPPPQPAPVAESPDADVQRRYSEPDRIEEESGLDSNVDSMTRLRMEIYTGNDYSE